jgi:NAD(P)-dependent dehydrogenase (short-subunit alcohol dehydrogenase family)
VAIVTGGASGIGLAATRRFAEEGARVTVADLDDERLELVESELGDAVLARRCDVRSEPDLDALVSATVGSFGGLDVVFANAGIGSLAPIVDAEASAWMRVIEVNLLGPFLTIKAAAPRMRAGGSIVLTASLNAVQPAGGMSAYCCSKAAVAMLAQVAAMELGPRRIRTNAIGPGLVRTGLTEAMWQMPSIVDSFVENAPLGIHPTAEEVASLVTFLASDEASSISGSLFLIDGAAHTKRYPDVLGNLGAARPE